ncbi:hypothetical protein, partial [Pseudoxanthomonas sangjuensis]
MASTHSQPPHPVSAGSYRHGCASTLRSASQKARDAQAARDAINRLRAFNLVEAMVGYVERLGPLDRIPIPLLLTIASNFSALNEQRRALKYLDEARRGDPEYPATLVARGHVLMYLGRLKEAES